MEKEKRIRCQIFCQRGKTIEAELSADTKAYEGDGIWIWVSEREEGGCRLGKLRLEMKNESCRGNDNLRADRPIRVSLPMEERPEQITAMYLFNEWWTRPAFVAGFAEIPEKTQVAFLRYKDRFSCIIPMVGREYKTCLTGGEEDALCLEMTSGLGGRRAVDDPLYVMAEGSDLMEVIHRVFSWLASYKGILLRTKRRIPEMFTYLGWCSWDAFYREVSEEGIREKAKELLEKKVPVRWMLIDDGWLSVEQEGELLTDFMPDPEKFPAGFKAMTQEIREQGAIRWFGVWHALGGYWGGIRPGSRLACKEQPYLYATANEKLIPSPFTGERFYRDWYKVLRREGIDFVKVDGQSAVPYYLEDSLPVCEGARGMHEALEGGASYMDGAIVNCMGMAMENILARPSSGLSRNSDDFMPEKEGGFAEHLLQNAYNSLYHDEIYHCDWDMFWTVHADSVEHSLLRAVSGGPVYVSDKVGATDPKILRPLAYRDGRLLMMERSAKPTLDCIFSDPMAGGVLKLHNVAPWGEDKGGGIAVYNLTKDVQSFTFAPEEIPELAEVDADAYWVFDYFQEKVFSLDRGERYTGTIQPEGFGWFIFLPRKKTAACLGLLEKYVGFTAVESSWEDGDKAVFVIREAGPIGWIAEKDPKKVLVNAADVTEQVKRDGKLFWMDLTEGPAKIAVSVLW